VTAKAKIILSDLHLGAGLDSEGNALEDFSSDADLAELIDALVEESDTHSLSLELIFAGDTFEFLQVPALTDPSSFAPGRVYPPDQYASSSEVASLSKVEIILAGHPVVFAALRHFVQASAPPRRVTFVKGNHDVSLHWSGVQRVLRAAVGAVGARESCVAFEERRISREGIYVEHGNQYCERINRFPDFEEPHDPDAPGELYRPPGSRFVYNYFNALEQQYRWLDGKIGRAHV
jgi:UDP-2,3-diacylglucosamine pyrophosphatase LpxH